MGTLLYEALVNMLLDEGDFSADELSAICQQRYHFSDYERQRSEIRLALNLASLCDSHIVQLPSGKYHKSSELPINGSQMLGFLERADENYFSERPWLREVYEDFKVKYGSAGTS